MSDEKDNKKAESKKEEVAELKADTTGHFEELAEKSKNNLRSGQKETTVDLIETVKVRFTKNVGYMKAGDKVHTISQTAYEIYKKKDAVEKV